MTLTPPLSHFAARRVNNTLHGRSVYRPEDVSGHNAFKGYNHPGTGDGLDLFAPGGEPVRAIGDCVQTRHSNDDTRKEVIYLAGGGWVAVYAHIDAVSRNTGTHFTAGDVVGYVRGDLNDPHLHFEFWAGDEHAVSGKTPEALHSKLIGLFAGGDAMKPVKLIGPDGELLSTEGRVEKDGRTWAPVRVVAEALGLEVVYHGDQGKVYLRRRD